MFETMCIWFQTPGTDLIISPYFLSKFSNCHQWRVRVRHINCDLNSTGGGDGGSYRAEYNKRIRESPADKPRAVKVVVQRRGAARRRSGGAAES